MKNINEFRVQLSTTDQLALKKLATLLMEILKVNNLLPSEAESFVTLLGAALYGRLKFLWEIVAVDLADSEGVLRQLITAGNDRLLLLALKCLRNITVK